LAKSTSFRLLPLTCPTCGGEIGLGRGDQVFLCKRCLGLWEEQGGELRPKKVRFFSAEKKSPYYLPFWTYSFTADTPTGKIDDFYSYTRYIAFPEVLGNQENRPLSLYVTAPPLSVDRYRLTISQRFTYTQPRFAPSEPVRGFIWGPVIDEPSARNYASLIFISTLSEARKASREFITAISLVIRNPVLSFIPFWREGNYFRNPSCTISIPTQLFAEKPARFIP
jgi:hypothetical protein